MNIVSNTTLKSSTATEDSARKRSTQDTNKTNSSRTDPNRIAESTVESKQDLKAKREDAWNCSACTYRNTILPDKCQVCRTPNPNYQPDPSLFPGIGDFKGEPGNDSRTPQRLLAPARGLSALDPSLVQQLQLHSIPAWICPQCRVLNARGTVRCALPDCQCPNSVVRVMPEMARRQRQDANQAASNGNQNTVCIVS